MTKARAKKLVKALRSGEASACMISDGYAILSSGRMTFVELDEPALSADELADLIQIEFVEGL